MSTNKLITGKVNLLVPPQPSDALAIKYNQITVGDLHANALKFIHFLMRHKIIELSNEDYQKLVAIYSTSVTQLSAQHIQQFNDIISRAKVNQTGDLVRLIGDELSDRGANDYFILKILQKLSQSNVPVEILFSNHGYEFLYAYEQCKKNPEALFYSRNMIGQFVDNEQIKYFELNPTSLIAKAFFQAQSINALQLSMNAGCFERDEVMAMIERVYLPMLKAISYTLSEDRKEITIYSHAAIGLNTIKGLAEKIETNYDDSSIDKLIETIDSINAKFKEKIKKGEASTLVEKTALQQISSNQPIENPNDHPWEILIWNRDYERIERPEQHHGIVFHWVHGHDKKESSKKNIYNLDRHNDVGHSMQRMQGSINYLLSNECAPYLGLISKKKEK